MTRKDIREAAMTDEPEGQKPSQGSAASEGGSGFDGVQQAGADAVPENTTGVNDPGSADQ